MQTVAGRRPGSAVRGFPMRAATSIGQPRGRFSTPSGGVLCFTLISFLTRSTET
jgi:hypothetical protein